jgi:exoribonuclease-2
MREPPPGPGSLVFYKTRPARVQRAGKKLEIELEGGRTLLVRPKDVVLLHPGPLEDLGELQPHVGEIQTAWELLSGTTTSLAELAELAYGTYTPATAWAAWQLVADGLYFRGSPQEVIARSTAEVEQEQANRAAQAAEQQDWLAFLDRVRDGQIHCEDRRYLREVEDLALARRTNSRVLRELQRTESPESAHALLLDLGAWDLHVDPYPLRLGLATSPPLVELPDLPDEERVDLRHLPAFAIDDEGNQEPDDALSLEGDRLWVHVADVAAVVRPDSPADLEARARGASLYLPEGTVPMLPFGAIQMLGLGLAGVSPALSFGLHLDPAGQIGEVEVVPSWVRVTRLTYQQAETRLEEEPFRSLHRLARQNHLRRRERGAVSIELPEVKIEVRDGMVIVRPIPPLRSRELVTETMLMAGEAVARLASQQDMALPFTTQDPPTIDERPSDLAGMVGLRRSLRPSQYSTVAGAHAGLGLESYVQATSPLRRYLDLVVHQQLRATSQGRERLSVQQILERVGATAAVANDVRQAERLACRHWKLVYLLQHPHWQGEAILVEQRGRQGTVLIPDLDLDARVHPRRDLPLNSSVRLTLAKVNLPELMAHFRVER